MPQGKENRAQFVSTRGWGRSRGNSRNAASGGKSEAVSRQRRDWRPKQGRESQGRNGVSPLPLEIHSIALISSQNAAADSVSRISRKAVSSPAMDPTM